jgi:hypothetical protein
LAKPSSNASDRLSGLNGKHGYSDYGSGYVDLPKLFANLYDGKDAITREFARDVGGALAEPDTNTWITPGTTADPLRLATASPICITGPKVTTPWESVIPVPGGSASGALTDRVTSPL